MNLYYKVDDSGIPHILPLNKIVILKDGMQVFNPTTELLMEEGWIEYVPASTEVSYMELLEGEKARIKDEIMAYDTSDSVNLFYIMGMPMWLDRFDRLNLMLRFETELQCGLETTSLWYNGMKFEFPVTTAREMLYAVERYASQCYDNTQMHLAQIDRITSIEELKDYDYTTGYPDKIHF